MLGPGYVGDYTTQSTQIYGDYIGYFLCWFLSKAIFGARFLWSTFEIRPPSWQARGGFLGADFSKSF